MKSKILIIYLLASISYSLHAQIKIGIRDNKFPYTSYTYKNTWGLKLEESIFSEDFAYQYIRGYLNYASTWKDLEIELSPYIGTQWNGNFQDYGMLCTLQCKFNYRFSIYGTLNPHKDTSWDYITCYEIGSALQITENIGFTLSYRNIPEYRIASKKIRIGMVFSEKRLTIMPCLSIPTEDNIKSTRLLINFEWTFRKKEQ